MAAKKKSAKRVDEKEIAEGEDTLRSMVSSLNELPTDVLRQLLHNLEEIEKYNKAHPEELKDPKGNK